MNNYQRDPKWANQILGFGTTQTIGNFGCTISVIGNILGLTPDVVNERLKAVKGFSGALVIWEKIAEAFPGTQVHRVWTYNNNDVLANVPNVIIEVPGQTIGGTGKHWIQGLGDGKCSDPWTGKTRPTSDFTKHGAWTGYCIIKPPKQEEGKPCNERRDELWNFTKQSLLKLGVEDNQIDKYSEKIDKLLEFVDKSIDSLKRATAYQLGEANKYKGWYESELNKVATEKAKRENAESALSLKETECQNEVKTYIDRINELTRDYPDIEKLEKSHEQQLGIIRAEFKEEQLAKEKLKVENARLKAPIKNMGIIEFLVIKFL